MFRPEMEVKKIIWAVDAFEEREGLLEKTAQILDFFQHKSRVQIEPVFILASSEVKWLGDFNSAWLEQFQTNLQHHLEEVLRSQSQGFILQPKILLEPLASTSAAVESLIDYCRKQTADLVIVSSHRRRGLDRFFLGSFAESLLAHSPLPVLVVGRGVKVGAQCRRVLFPTDFGEASRPSFRRALTIANQMGADLTLFHAIPLPAQIVMDTGYYPAMYGVEGEIVTLEDFVRAQADRQSRRAESWTEWAQQEGVNSGFKVDSSGSPVDTLICTEAEKGVYDLIVMESHSKPLKTALLGSTTRNVVRMAPCPVLVLPRECLQLESSIVRSKEKVSSMQVPNPL